jgi:hypothetical protein
LRQCADWRKSRLIIAGERGGLFVFVKNAVSGRENLAPGSHEASQGLALAVVMLAQGESLIQSLIRRFMPDTILME